MKLDRDPGAALHAAILEHPDDDHARQVYADFLLERGDPRGELIALQLAGRDPERQRALLDQHARAWLEPLTPWLGAWTFARGFLAEAQLAWLADPRSYAHLVGHPTWATLERLDLCYSDRLPGELIRHPIMRALRHVGGMQSAALQELLAWSEIPLASIGTGSVLLQEIDALRRAVPALRRLRAFSAPQSLLQPDEHDWLWETELGARLETLTIGVLGPGELDRWLARLTRGDLSLRTLCLWQRHDHRALFELTRAPGGRLASLTAHLGAGDQAISYDRLVEVLTRLPRDRITQLRVTGHAPGPEELPALDGLRKRFAGLALELP